jgi:DNA-binding transcriptional LysR family regulator
MTNVPTDLLRTFVSVVELRSFTRAAKAQSMTQPAVSAQIRRLQTLLAVELFDKSAPGVSLTATGEQVLDFGRRLLAVNDRIVEIASPNSSAQLVRIGVRKDCMGEQLVRMLTAARARWPSLRFNVRGAGQRRLLQYLEKEELDVVVALVPDDPVGSARHYWTEELAWVRGHATTFDLDAPLPLIAYKDRCLCHRIAVAMLAEAGLAAELVFRANTAEALRSAVAAGVGVMLMPRSCVPAELEVWDDGSLPAVAPVYCGIFVQGERSDTFDQLADHFAETLRPAAANREPRLYAPRHDSAATASSSL